ncbi:hypothetical protein GCM10012319_52410 [Comamonas sp. KCTC 72670]|nr:hypothetical protein GCM10012319_52410 [Comamonas sp. KCTC 72670]
MPHHPTGPGLDGPAVTIERAAELLHCKRTRVFELIAEGRLKRAPKLGKKTTVRLDSVLACVKGEEDQPPSAPRPRRRPQATDFSLESFKSAVREAMGGSSG